MEFTAADIEELLRLQGDAMEELLVRADQIRRETVGEGVYLRGLIEYSNICRKNCLYCGIRRDSDRVGRYTLSPEQVLGAARFAWENDYGSVVLQGGEQTSPEHVTRIEELVREIKKLSGGELGITLSFGEQTPDTYKRWFDAGAHRYLLRIETSDEQLYEKIHPADGAHSFESRLKALADLRAAGYQVGTGVMIGLPGQTLAQLAHDIMFMRDLDIDMCGMGPYIESEGTPLACLPSSYTLQERLDLTLKMIASLRLAMPDINIAATTALQAIDPRGRIRALGCGANVIMPNITPEEMRGDYSLYNNKPLSLDSTIIESQVRYGEWGDSRRFACRKERD